MAFSDPAATPRRRRLLIAGDVNTGKSTALIDTLRWYRANVDSNAQMGLISYPGEHGYESIPVNEPGLIARIWQVDPSDKPKSLSLVNEVKQATTDLISGKFGPIAIFAGDGLHKYFEFEFDAATNGAHFKGEEIEGRQFPYAYSRFKDYLSLAMHSRVPLVLFTSWARLTAERKAKSGEKSKDIPQKIYPLFPGEMGRNMVGEVGVCVMQLLRKPPVDNPEGLYDTRLVVKTPQRKGIRMWQTQPHGDVAGVGIKGPKELTEKIPVFIPAQYSVLSGYLDGGAK